MRKSQLLLQNEKLFDQLRLANLDNKRLKNENQLLKEKVEMLTHQLSNAESTVKSNVVVEDEVIADENSEVSDTDEFKDGFNIVVPDDPPVLSPETEYGAKIIGEIVMQSAIFSDKVSERGKPNIKELINLILGKTEVAKSEILNIVLSDTSLENKYSMMDSQLIDTVEYFKSVLDQ